jgi:hypothetical protein
MFSNFALFTFFQFPDATTKPIAHQEMTRSIARPELALVTNSNVSQMSFAFRKFGSVTAMLTALMDRTRRIAQIESALPTNSDVRMDDAFR